MLGSRLPTITCVMATRGRIELLKKAVSCYVQQSYMNKNMVIVSQGCDEENEAIRGFLSALGRSDISCYTAHPDTPLGTMRNTTVEIARGEVICQWDDDDLYHPDRLMMQYNVLRADSRRVASVYCDFLKYYKTTGDLYWCDWSGEPIPAHRYLCGSVMFHRTLFDMYPVFYPQSGNQCHVEEDLNVLFKLHTKGDIGPVWSGWHYVYVYHGENTYDLDHHNWTLNTSTGKRVLDTKQLVDRKSLLEHAFDVMGIDQQVKVRSKDDIAFVYQPNQG
jgi:glycosyltransferase involved in cell wall biosynthesis